MSSQGLSGKLEGWLSGLVPSSSKFSGAMHGKSILRD